MKNLYNKINSFAMIFFIIGLLIILLNATMQMGALLTVGFIFIGVSIGAALLNDLIIGNNE